ncbi:MAG: GerMN domain-containing protein [Acidimicrobiales bacterium]
MRISWCRPWCRPGRLVLGALALSTGLAGCGVGPQSAPRALDRSKVPFGLLSSTTTTTPSTEPSSPALIVYFEQSHHLVPVRQAVAGPVSVGAALDALGAGPTTAEAAAGLTSPASSAAPFVAGRVQSGLVNIDVNSAFANLAGQSQILAAAQLVFTATSVPGVTRVALSVGGQQSQVPTADGSLTQAPLTRSDYASLAPPG